MIEEITDEKLQIVLKKIVEAWRDRYSIRRDGGFGITAKGADRGEYTAVIRQYADNPGLCLWLSFSRQGPRPGHCEPVSAYAIDFYMDWNHVYVFDLRKRLSEPHRRRELYDLARDFVTALCHTTFGAPSRKDILELWEILGNSDDGTMGLHTDDASYLAVRVGAKMFLRMEEQRYEININRNDDGVLVFDLSSFDMDELLAVATIVRSLLRVRREIVGGENG